MKIVGHVVCLITFYHEDCRAKDQKKGSLVGLDTGEVLYLH